MSNTSLTKSRKSSTLQVLPALPYMLWLVVFIAVPLGLVLFFALTDSSGSFTLDNIVQAGEHMQVLLRSIKLAAIATFLCVVLAYPLAYIISRRNGFRRRTLLMLVMLPMWMNFLLRTYAWMTDRKSVV